MEKRPWKKSNSKENEKNRVKNRRGQRGVENRMIERKNQEV